MAGRTSGQMAHRKKAFLDAFRRNGNITSACLSSGVGRSSVYRWQEADERFLHEYRQAEIEATEVMEAEAHRRGVLGCEKPVYQGGAMVGTVREYSDTLLIFMLKARNPGKYRDRHDGPPDGQPPLKVVDQAAYEGL